MSGPLCVGQSAETVRAFQPADLADYLALGGAARADGALPEPLIAALWSRLLGVDLPGVGTNYLKQETRFHAPARVGEALSARVEITRIRADKHLVDLAVACRGADGRLIADGRALVAARDTGRGYA